jgi:hypothetical protein
MAEVVRLSVLAGSRFAQPPAPPAAPGSRASLLHHRAFLTEANRLEDQVRALQARLEDAAPAFTASRSLGYRRLVERVRSAVAEAVPRGSTVLVVSRGDRELLKLGDACAAHFPQSQDGEYLGHHPRDSSEAIARLEQLRGGGADYLVLPSTSYWWLEHYAGFARHLRDRYPVVERGVCSIFRLCREEPSRAVEVAR